MDLAIVHIKSFAGFAEKQAHPVDVPWNNQVAAPVVCSKIVPIRMRCRLRSPSFVQETKHAVTIFSGVHGFYDIRVIAVELYMAKFVYL